MQKFLEKLANYSISLNIPLENIQIVLPNRRAKVYLVEHFHKQLKKESWLPNIKSLEDFIIEGTKLSLLSQSDLMVELYKVHRDIEGKKADTFEDFSGWGQLLLQDFNEIDRYLINGNDLYGYLTEAKAIESWNIDNKELSPFQNDYLKFWNSLSVYYHHFREHLLNNNKAYQGLIFEQAASSLNVVSIDPDQGIEKILFAGFNALAKSEQIIMDSYVNKGLAEYLWDADSYYLDNKIQESGNFLRQHKKRIKDFKWVNNSFKEIPKEINIYGVSGNMGQCKFVGNLLLGKDKDSLEKTAVVLSDEEILPLLIESLPDNVEKFNITMGYPLRQSTFYDFVMNYIKLYETAEVSNSSNIHFKNLISLLKSDLFHFTKDSFISKIDKLIKKIMDESIFYPSIDLIENYLGNNILKFPRVKESAITKLEALLLLFDKLDIEKLKEKNYLFSQFSQIKSILNELVIKLDKEEFLNSTKTLSILFKQLVSLSSTTIKGEPLRCLQIMGVLETRTLDFDELIITSLNEGILPAGKSQNSFIPFDIKKKFGLPSYQDKDAIFSYHFYRLLQRAKKITLVYNQKVDALMGGEKSRFIMQLKHELRDWNPNINIHEQSISPAAPPKKNNSFNSFVKTEKVLEIIRNLIEVKGLSASAINTYLKCKKDFYFKYVLGVREDNKNDFEDLDASIFGEVVHRCLELIYKPFENELIKSEMLEISSSNYIKSLNQSFEEIYKVIPETGEPKIQYELAKKIIKDYLKEEIEFVNSNELHLVALEKKLSKSIKLNLANKGESIDLKLKGTIDRIDKANGNYRIIDYKTSKVLSSDFSISNRSNLMKTNKPKLIQLWVYKLLAEEISNENFEAAMIGLKNAKAGLINNKAVDDKEKALEFLSEVIEDMLNPESIIEHNKDSKYCSFCKNK